MRLTALTWTFEPWIVASLALAVAGYVCGVQRLHARSRSRAFGAARCTAFAAGIATLVVALISPLDALDDELFAAHMVQHLLLMMVAAPLLVWSRPASAWLWAFPLGARRIIGALWLRLGLRRGVGMAMAPASVWMFCSATLWFWHLPGPYDYALASESVHALEHACFFASSLMFWSLVLEPYGPPRRLGYGASLLFVATLGMQNGLLGALLVFAGHPLYSAYASGSPAWGLTALEDQQLAGLIMWVPASLIHLTTLAVLFVAWLQLAERQAQRAARGTTPAAPPKAASMSIALRCVLLVPLLLIVALAGCERVHTEPDWVVRNANARNAPALMQQYGCVICHTVPGIAGANGRIGPPLTQFAQRTYIAGVLRNTPDNLVKWLRHPQSVVPGNAMPEMGLSEQQARDIAAYLYASR